MKTRPVFLITKVLIALLFGLAFSCTTPSGEKIKIAVSKNSPNYHNWLLQSDSTILITNMYPMGVDSAVSMLGNFHALLITGGEDVFPGWYGMEHDTVRCGEFDRYRDTLEIMLIRKALELNMPVLGICRGHQILNVALGGTLFIDIPEDIGSEVIHRCEENPFECYHQVMVVENSLLREITGLTEGMVNTNHHQAVNKPAPGISISAVSYEGLTEAIEWEEFRIKPFLLGVQWHPERLEKHPELSRPIADRFIREASLQSKAERITK